MQLGRPGVDLAIALVPETAPILPRIARQPGIAHGPSCASFDGPKYARAQRVGRPSAAPGRSAAGSAVRRPARSRPGRSQRRSAASRDPSGQSLNCSVSQRPTRPGGSTAGASATSSWRRVHSSAVRPPIASPGRPAPDRERLPHPTRTRPPKRSQLVPLMAIGTSGTPDRIAKYAAPSLSGSRSASPGWIRPSPAIATTAAVVDARRRPAGSRRGGRSCPACTGSPSRSSASPGSGRRRACPPPSGRRRRGAAATAGSPSA